MRPAEGGMWFGEMLPIDCSFWALLYLSSDNMPSPLAGLVNSGGL